MDAVIEDVIVAQNLEESSAHVSMSTTANSTRSNKATRQLKLPIRYQRDAPQDLDLVSWPPRKRVPGSGMMLPFAYDVAKGVDTYIYIIDNGINKANAVRTPNSSVPASSPNTVLGIPIDAVAART